MKAKTLCSMLLIFLVLLLLPVNNEANAQTGTIIFINPASGAAQPGQFFTVNINVSNVVGLNAWEIRLQYNPLLLYTNRTLIKEGPFLNGGGIYVTFFAPPYFDAGSAYLQIGALITSNDAVDGSGTLATITFKVLRLGETVLDLYDTKLLNVNLASIQHSEADGYFQNVESSRIPTASFTYTSNVYNVTFDGSNSYSPYGNIANYIWYFGDGANATKNVPITWHKYQEIRPPQEKNYTAILIVIDSNGITGKFLPQIITVGMPCDVAVIGLKLSPRQALPGAIISINVTVSNEGTVTESFNVSTYYRLGISWVEIGMQPVTNLVFLDEQTLIFQWNTTGLNKGLYPIKAQASIVPNETDIIDNTFIDGKVALTRIPQAFFSYTPTEPEINATVTFDASASFDPDGTIVGYLWDFGDGTTINVTVSSVTHSFPQPKTYVVTLTVTDNSTATNATTESVSVSKLRSLLSISTNSPLITLGSAIIITGYLTPSRLRANVTMFYRLQPQQTWTNLTIITVNGQGNFSYAWRPTNPGTYEFKSSWVGDNITEGTESNIAKVTIEQPGPPGILFYAAGAIVVVAVIGTALYFLMSRKQKTKRTRLRKPRR